ncbi:MAG: ABC transporter ATP-binding protein [Bacteroides sp.]|nr:ABC transporter ATP-binding protein [Bacteroides sp.]MCM1085726.1 ABC transporter ATP-binding protein [Bacteroides sp.]
MIEIKDLSFRYGKHYTVFEQLNMNLKAGYIYGLLGENGVGKTTLLRMLAGLRFPCEGSIRIMGHDPRRRSPELLSEVYYLPEVIDPVKLSLNEYVRLYSPFYPRFSHEQLAHYVSELGINPTRKINKSSHGQQKKAMMCFALACNTKLLLMDEPTNGMDIPSKGIFRRLIAQAADDSKCFVISTHQVRDLENLIDPIIILERNRILLNNSVEEITRKLWFGRKPEKSDKDLYREECVGGYNIVGYNEEGEETKVDIEMLFNAAIQNKGLFKRMFIDELNPELRSDFAIEMEKRLNADSLK